MTYKAFCIHGHFYQPPREDPLTGEIPVEPGAVPYHNWNERIHDQCYRPNALLGNFERISFNIGPTLMNWIAEKDARTLDQIIEQDRWNLERNGVGNAMAQSYNHTILPLANRVDKVTQVRWGLADFRNRFGHEPDGMWLPETGVDLETLSVLAENGIAFTILAPWQADVDHVDTSQPYRVELPGGKQIVVFFYEQDLSTRISFDPGATVNADDFINQFLTSKFSNNGKGEPQLVMVASDGELYGHHQPFRDKFLAYLMGGALANNPIQVTYPGLWLKQYPVTRTIKIREASSWSCHHGVTRWKGACGCTPHGEWKAPLRYALNSLAKLLDEQYFLAAGRLVADPWELRHDYIQVVLGELSTEELIRAHAGYLPGEEQLLQIKLLLTAQFERQRMFTSCGWFFDDFDRIEPRNNVSYAAQAVWLTYRATGVDYSEHAADWLAEVKSWRTNTRADTVFIQYLQRARGRHGVNRRTG
jgi:alpha-amylase/alpha-mannosidase (GH57 family)